MEVVVDARGLAADAEDLGGLDEVGLPSRCDIGRNARGFVE